jgi:nucleotide-binding universal stress UspA family protein
MDGSARSRSAIDLVRPIVERGDELLLVQVQQPECGHELERELDYVRRDLGQRARAQIVVGADPARLVLDFAERWRPTLIALATHGRTGLPRWIRGSVAERILRGSPCPVLAANERALMRARGARRTIVIAADPRAERSTVDEALDYLGELGLLDPDGSRVVVVGAVSPLARGTSQRECAHARELLEAACARLARRDVQARIVLSSSPATGLVRALVEEKADLAVLATHGRMGVSRWIHGSVTEEVLRRAWCPVLALHAPAAVCR